MLRFIVRTEAKDHSIPSFKRVQWKIDITPFAESSGIEISAGTIQTHLRGIVVDITSLTMIVDMAML